MPSNHLIHCRPLLLPPSIFLSPRVFSKESVLHIRWPKRWSFSFSINESSGLISFRVAWLDLLAAQGTLESRLSSSSLVSFLSVCWLALFSSLLEDVLRRLRALGGCEPSFFQFAGLFSFCLLACSGFLPLRGGPKRGPGGCSRRLRTLGSCEPSFLQFAGLFSILSVGLLGFLPLGGCSQASEDPRRLLAFTWAAVACLLDGCPAHAHMGDAPGSGLLCHVCGPRVVSENWTLCAGSMGFASSLHVSYGIFSLHQFHHLQRGHHRRAYEQFTKLSKSGTLLDCACCTVIATEGCFEPVS